MKRIIFLLINVLLVHRDVQAESIFKCQSGDQFRYQSVPCDKGVNAQKLETKSFNPDPATLKRLEEQHLDFVKQTDPAEYHRLKRLKLSPSERLEDERLEEQERLQQMQMEQSLQQQERYQQEVLREMEAQRLQAQQFEQERLALERQRLIMQQRSILLQPYYPQPNHPHKDHKDLAQPMLSPVSPNTFKPPIPEIHDPSRAKAP